MSHSTNTAPKPLPADELLQGGQSNSELPIDIKIPEEVNYRNLVRKLENKAKHLEIQIEQNRKRGTAITQECFNAMRATEVLAFDFLFTEYLMGTASISQVYTFVDSCIRPSFNIVSGDPRDIDAAADHIRTVQTQIQNSISSVIRFDQKKIETTKRASDFLQFLRERKQSLEIELKKNEEDLKNSKSLNGQPTQLGQLNQSQLGSQKAKETIISVDFNDSFTSQFGEVDPNFEKWILSELKPGAVSVDAKTAETRALFGTCIHRIQAIDDLREQIGQLKANSTATHNLQYIDCDPVTIYNSPFFKAIQDNCGFLGTALKAIHNHQQLIPGCNAAIENCENSLKELEKKCQNTLSQMKQNTIEMESSIEQSKAEIASMTEKLKPYADALQFDVTSLDTLQKETNEYDQSLEKYLQNLLETSTDENMKEKLDSQIKLLHELREIRQSISKLCQTSFASISNNIKTQNDLFKTILTYSKAVEYVQLYEREVQQLEEYEKALKQVIDIMHVDEVTNWCRQLTDISDSILEAVKNQEEIFQSFEPLTKIDESGNEEIAAKEAEVEALIAKNGKLVEEEARIHCETVDAEEELFRLMQEIQGLGGWTDKSLETKLSGCATCPICKERQRNQILLSCGHPLCNECIAASMKDKKTCPLCSKPFVESDVKPFNMQ